MDPKNIVKSKTFWFNALAILLVVAKQFGFGETALTGDQELTIVTVVNLVLRLFTTQPVFVGAAPAKPKRKHRRTKPLPEQFVPPAVLSDHRERGSL